MIICTLVMKIEFRNLTVRVSKHFRCTFKLFFSLLIYYYRCNCGLTRQIRCDPFSLVVNCFFFCFFYFYIQEANYKFYQRTDFSFGKCCAELDRYEFLTFNPSDIDLHSSSITSQPAFKNDSSEESPNDFSKSSSLMVDLGKTKQNVIADEEEAIGAVDPHEYNFRFFDGAEDDEHLPSEES